MFPDREGASSVAIVLLASHSASLALHLAAPDEPAVAFLLDVLHHGLVSSAAAQDLAAVHAPAGLVAQPPHRAQYTEPV